MLKISAVSYLNTFPFVYGLKKSGQAGDFRLELDVPSVCARKLQNGEADIALVPVGALPDIPGHRIVSPYCIGAKEKVRTVLLLSRVPLREIRSVHLDYDSRTSVRLVRILAKHYWQINPQWYNLQTDLSVRQEQHPSLVAIGDKTFRMRDQYPYVYDLAEEWYRFTGLPFVFAVWVTRKQLPETSIRALNKDLEFGLKHKAEALDYFRARLPECGDCLAYLENDISYELDQAKREGMALFLSYLSELP